MKQEAQYRGRSNLTQIQFNIEILRVIARVQWLTPTFQMQTTGAEPRQGRQMAQFITCHGCTPLLHCECSIACTGNYNYHRAGIHCGSLLTYNYHRAGIHCGSLLTYNYHRAGIHCGSL